MSLIKTIRERLYGSPYSFKVSTNNDGKTLSVKLKGVYFLDGDIVDYWTGCKTRKFYFESGSGIIKKYVQLKEQYNAIKETT